MRQKYNVIIFFSDSPDPCKYRNVTYIDRLLNWVENNLQGGRNWQYANIYDAKTKQYKYRIKNRYNYGN